MKNNLKDDMLNQVSGGTVDYESMFSGNTSLQAAPTLPATELADNNYQYMFDGMDISRPKYAGSYQVGIDIPGSGNYTPGSPEIPGFTIMDK